MMSEGSNLQETIVTHTNGQFASGEGAPVPDRKEAREYAFKALPNKDLIAMDEDDLAKRRADLMSIIEIAQEELRNAETEVVQRRADLETEASKAEAEAQAAAAAAAKAREKLARLK